jgi:hypothetical protein
VFLQDRELLVTGNYWYVVINFDVQWYQGTLQVIEEVFKHLEWSRNHRGQQSNLVDWEEVDHAHAAVNNVNQELSTLAKLLPTAKDEDSNHRGRRGLINVGGDVLKFLFGVATTQQMQELHTTVEHIKTRDGEVIHAIQKQLTYLKSIDEAISENAIGLATVARVLKRVITNALAYQRKFEDAVQNLETLVYFQANVSRTMRELEFTVMQLQQSVIQLQEGLEISAAGRLSSVLIPPHNLSKILQEVTLRLPQDVSLIAGFNVENMYVYYEVATVQAYATATAIRLIVRLPLRGADRVMTLFKSIPLPTYSEVLGRHIQIEPETPYLAVTENRQYYSLVTTADLQHCKKGPVTICEATFPFIHKNQATCTSALYFGQTDFSHKLCRKLILTGKFNPVWIQAKGSHPFWIYSLPSSIIVTKTCKMNGTTHSSNMELSHTGILKEDINCQFYSETFILLPVSDGYTNVSFSGSQVLPPHLPELMSTEERRQITYDERQTRRTLAALETIVRRSSHANQQPYVELRDLLESMSSEGAMASQATWLYTLSALSLTLSFVVLTLKYWRRPITSLIRKFVQCVTDNRPCMSQITNRQAEPGVPASSSETTNCPRCAASTNESEEGEASHSAAPLRMEAGAVPGPTSSNPPEAAERISFAQPGKFQLLK